MKIVFIKCTNSFDAFIGYGGNVVRDKVRDNASWFVTDFQQLIDEL